MGRRRVLMGRKSRAKRDRRADVEFRVHPVAAGGREAWVREARAAGLVTVAEYAELSLADRAKVRGFYGGVEDIP
jgi:hypothetical protein